MGGTLIEGIRQWCLRRWSSSITILWDQSTTDLDSSKQQQESEHLTKDIETPYSASELQPEKQDHKMQTGDPRRKCMVEADFFTEYGEANRYKIQEVIGKGSYGVVCSAIDTHTGEKVAIKKINDIFEHVSDATRILREIKLLRLLRHPDIVEIKHIMLPPSRREFKDIYVVFELMESDLHQVIKANDDLTPEHYQFFLYQLFRGLKYIHTANVFHRDLKPKNVLANADCKLKLCDFGLARVAFNDAPTAIFWTDYVATRWYRAPELCGSFFSKYTPAVDIWSIGCIFAELLTGKPLFPGKNVVHQLDLMTDLLGSPSLETISRVRNEKAKRYLATMRKKPPVPFVQKFPNADPLALRLLERLLAFDPRDRPSADEALADPYFKGLANIEKEPSAQAISKIEFEFERRRINKDDVRELIYREILEYHPQMLKEYLSGNDHAHFLYPSAVDQFKRQFAHLEEHYGTGGSGAPLERQPASLPRASLLYSNAITRSSEQRVGVSSKERLVEYRESIANTSRDIGKKSLESSADTLPKSAYSTSQQFQGMLPRPGKVINSGFLTLKDGGKEVVGQRKQNNNASGSISAFPGVASTSHYSFGRQECDAASCSGNKKDDTVMSDLDALRSKAELLRIAMSRKATAIQSGHI